MVGSAWTAPGWMKVGNNVTTRKGVLGGTLNGEYVETYAEYLSKIMSSFKARNLPFDAITMQNEPAFSPSDYASMLLSADQEAELAIAVGKKFQEKGLHTKILVHDHNWDIADRAIDILKNSTALQYIDGVAFHCYAGDVSAQSTVKQLYPQKDIYFTECSGTSQSELSSQI
jgi:glucosylceramidase